MGRFFHTVEAEQRESAMLGHCRRVAALGCELSRRAGLDARLDPVLAQAAQFHDSMELLLDPTPLGRLATDVLCGAVPRGAERTPHAPPAIVEPEVRTVLSLFHHRRVSEAAPPLRALAGILSLCHIVDEQFESLEFEHRQVATILDELQEIAAMEGFDPRLVAHLRAMQCPGLLQSVGCGDALPVEACTARLVFRSLGQDREYEVHELADVARRDPVLTGSLIGVANSALHYAAGRISSISKAISFLGTAASRRVMLAASMRPLFASAGVSRLWSHSVSTAQFCSALAAQTGFTTAEEGLMLGLLHDIGALAAEFLARQTRDSRARLTEKGCPATYVERLLFGADHGELGGAILAHWGFPEQIVEAVRFHHQPERSSSPLAAFLYLAEFWSGHEEDLPSFYRVEDCLTRTGLSLESLTQVGARDKALGALRAVA